MNQGLVLGLNGGMLSGKVWVPPFTGFNDGQEFAIMNWIIALHGIQHHRQKSHRLICLGKDTTDSKITCICFNYKW